MKLVPLKQVGILLCFGEPLCIWFSPGSDFGGCYDFCLFIHLGFLL